MKKKNAFRYFSYIAFLGALCVAPLLNCITVNVNFPESAVQKAADNFVHDLYKGTDEARTVSNSSVSEDAAEVKKSVQGKKKKATKPSAEPTSFLAPVFQEVANLLIPAAQAVEVSTELKMDTSKAMKIRQKMKARVPEILEWKGKGVLGETFDGMLVLKEPGKVSDADRSKVKSLVSEENDDREDLYEEIQDANSIQDKKQTRIRRFFGAAFHQNSPKGTYIEDESGNWRRK